jgi:hypothetical protein
MLLSLISIKTLQNNKPSTSRGLLLSSQGKFLITRKDFVILKNEYIVFYASLIYDCDFLPWLDKTNFSDDSFFILWCLAVISIHLVGYFGSSNHNNNDDDKNTFYHPNTSVVNLVITINADQE